MKKFEYKVECLSAMDAQETEDTLNSLGEEGWELVFVEIGNGIWAYLKREKTL